MLSIENLVLLDERLRTIYNSNLEFRGKSIILCSDFLQMPCIGGTPICKAMYIPSNSTQVTGKYLFSKFRIFQMNQQVRAKCDIQKKLLADFRKLPTNYPTGKKWSAQDSKEYKPISTNIINTITRELSLDDINKDNTWIDTLKITNNNFDRYNLNLILAKKYADKNNSIVIKWKKKILNDNIPITLLNHIYNENLYPNLFSIFVPNAPDIILSNKVSNVILDICNGTKCIFHSLTWLDKTIENKTSKIIQNAVNNNIKEVIIDDPPDFINVKILDPSTNKIKEKNTFPINLNLNNNNDNNCIIIPIPIIKDDNYVITVDNSKERILYEQHSVDPAFTITVWKSQGNTLDKVIVDIEPTINQRK